ncbi:MAG: O-acetyl-ADP-ribose deacetylase [Myxococcota bacterium]
MSGRMLVKQGDITQLTVDAIVNAANSSLLGGSGVDGAIHRAAGPALLEACMAIRARQGSCLPGHAVITPAGQLRANHVIHAVGPVWQGGDRGEPGLLASCYMRSLELAAAHGDQSVAFPAISCGVYRFPVMHAAQIATRTVMDWLRDHPQPKTVLFCCFTDEVWAAYRSVWDA